MSKRIRIFAAEDLAQHASPSSCWVTRNGRVYDVTSFLADHPGGDDLILNYGGKDIGAIMKDPAEHEHSDSAYDMLEEFVIGRIVQGENLVSEGERSYHCKRAIAYSVSCSLRLGGDRRLRAGRDGHIGGLREEPIS